MNYERTQLLVNAITIIHSSYPECSSPETWNEKAFSLLEKLMSEDEAKIIIVELAQIDAAITVHQDMDARRSLAYALAGLSWFELEDHYSLSENVDELDVELFNHFS